MATKKKSKKHAKKAKKSSGKDFAKLVSKMENEIKKSKERLAKLRRRLPKQEVQDYSLSTPTGKVSLSSLFGGREDLILIHNMGASCPYCTLWADGYNGLTSHFENKAAFAVVSEDSAETQAGMARERGWKFKMFSTLGSTLKKDLGFADSSGDQAPGVSILRKDKNGKIFQVAKTYFGPGDNYCVAWDFFDLLPSGSGDWEPQYRY